MPMQMGKESTINQFIRHYNNDDVRYDSFYTKNVIEANSTKMVILDYSILDMYRSELASKIVERTLTPEEFRKYRFNPKRLSYDTYGTTEYWFLILHANELTSASQFNINPIKIYDGSIMDTLNRIMSLQKEITDQNNAEVDAAINNISTFLDT